MPNYTIAEEPLNLEYLKELYELNRGRYHDFSYANLNCIFDIACHNPSMFPTINVQEVSDCVPYIYMGKWFDRYFDALMNIPCEQKVNPSELEVVATTFSEPETTIKESAYDPLSPKNIHKTLLQLFISRKVKRYGFIWCVGNVLEGIDFCNTDGSFFLKIQDKPEIEKSSNIKFSHYANMKKGPCIRTWSRLETECTAYNWPLLNNLVNRHRTDGFDFDGLDISEKDYQQFLTNITYRNYELSTLLDK